MTDIDSQNQRKIPVDYQVPDDASPSYANNLVIQHTESEFTIHFFYTRLPILLGDGGNENLRAKIESIEAIRPQFIKSIIVSPKKMQEFIDALQDSLDKFIAKHQNDELGE